MSWKSSFGSGKEIVLVSSSKKGKPHAIVVVSLGFVDGKLLIADCQMRQTMRNLQENPFVVLMGGYVRVSGKVVIHDCGRYFDLCVKKNKSYVVKHALVVSVGKVFDVNKVKQIV